MTLKEWNEVKHLSYYEFVNYLNNKYGAVKGNYFELREDGTLKKGKARVKGYYIHHVKENEIRNLCQASVAAANPIEYQYSENLVQSDVLEHLFLHILIAEDFDNTGDLCVGESGISWIATTTNMKINKLNFSEEEQQVFLKLINRYCTSSFIRQKSDKAPKDLLKRLLGQGDIKNYSKYLSAAEDTKLFPWNVNAFSELQKYLRTERTAGLVICTGGGKTTTALEYLRVYDARALILGPSNTIGTGWESNSDKDRFGYTYMNYQTFQNDYPTIDYSKYDVIICDEMHHTDAMRWGEGLQYVLDHTNLKIIGLTATPSDDQKQGADKYFGGRLCWGLNLAEGVNNNNIHPFSYVSAIYKLEKEMFDKYGEVGRQMYGHLDIAANENPIHKILKDNMPSGIRKIIVFVQRKEMFEEAKDAMIKYNPKYATEEYSRTIYSGIDPKYIDEAKKWFNQKHDHDVVLYTINMANEGAHFEGINTLIMFRQTNSATLYLQQLGRIVVTTNKPDPHGIVFDFTNNAQTLINKSTTVVKTLKEDLAEELDEDDLDVDLDASTVADQEVIDAIQEAIKNKAEEQKQDFKTNRGKVIIYKDYTEDCAETLAALHDAQKRSNTDAQIYVELQSIFNLDPDFKELWKELKVSSVGRILISTKQIKSDKPKPSNNHKADRSKDETTVKQIVSASEAELLATVYKLIVRRAYNLDAIGFTGDSKVAVEIKDRSKLDSICLRLGIRNSGIIVKALKNLPKLTFIIANTLDDNI